MSANARLAQADLDSVISSLREAVQPAIADPERSVTIDLDSRSESVDGSMGGRCFSYPSGREEYVLRVRVGPARRPVPWARAQNPGAGVDD